jgi:hypothetical protein
VSGKQGIKADKNGLPDKGVSGKVEKQKIRLEDFFDKSRYKIKNGWVIHDSGLSYQLSHVANTIERIKPQHPQETETELIKRAIRYVESAWWSD